MVTPLKHHVMKRPFNAVEVAAKKSESSLMWLGGSFTGSLWKPVFDFVRKFIFESHFQLIID